MRRNFDVRFSPALTDVTMPPVSAARRSDNPSTVAEASDALVRSTDAGRSGSGVPRMVATVGVLRLATSSSASASLMLLLSCPSLKSTTSCRRPGASAVASATASASKTALLPPGRSAASAGSTSADGCVEVHQPADPHVEREKTQAICSGQVGPDLPQRAPQLVEHGAGDAGADVEHQRDVDRQLLVGHAGDLLRDAVVEQLEVGRLQARHGPSLALDRGVDGDNVGAGAEHGCGLLRRRWRRLPGRRRHQDRSRQDQHRGERRCLHRPISRSFARIAG